MAQKKAVTSNNLLSGDEIAEHIELVKNEQMREYTLLGDISKVRNPAWLFLTNKRLALVDAVTKEVLQEVWFDKAGSLVCATRKKPRIAGLVVAAATLFIALMSLAWNKIVAIFLMALGCVFLFASGDTRLIVEIYADDEKLTPLFTMECEPFDDAEKFLTKIDKSVKKNA